MGKYTIKETLYQTLHGEFSNRLTNSGRDVLKMIRIESIKEMSRGAFAGKFTEPIKKFRVKTYSYPQYKPYTSYKGKLSLRQRTVRHDYDIVLELDRLSVNTRNWLLRVGSEKLLKKPSQSIVKQIYTETREDWYSAELKKAHNNVKIAKTKLAEKIKRHKNIAKYISVGDWQSQVLGINQDFLFRCEWVYSKMGHLYGKNRTSKPPTVTNPKQILFFDKHSVRFVQYLLNKGILKND